VETWLARITQAIDRRKVSTCFYLHAKQESVNERAVREAGARVHYCGGLVNPAAYVAGLGHFLWTQGPFDIVHSHLHHFSGLVLATAQLAKVPVRIAHSHSDTRERERGTGVPRRLYLRLTEFMLGTSATHALAASNEAGMSLFGDRWEPSVRSKVLHCGIDLRDWRKPASRREVRAEFGIPMDALVVGHVGRLSPPKNHGFFVEVCARLARSDPRYEFLLVGDGPEKASIESASIHHGLERRLRFAGARSDVARVLRAMDVFLFPSLWEGMPLSLIEAQAAGLRCVVSDRVTREADVVPGLVHYLRLEDGPVVWADAVRTLAGAPAPDSSEALRVVEGTDFEIGASVMALTNFYEQAFASK
jgi:glycosyltransferase involved in cell wall biosynthesis